MDLLIIIGVIGFLYYAYKRLRLSRDVEIASYSDEVNDVKSEVYGPEVAGFDQFAPGLYVSNKPPESVFLQGNIK